MRAIVIAGGCLLLLAACATLQNRGLLRDEALEGYGAALRWGDIESAWRFVDPALRKAQPLTPEQKSAYAAVRVAQYEASRPVKIDAENVEQTARIRLIVQSSQQAYDVVDHQQWHWDDKARHWWLMSGLPDITQRHPANPE